MEQLEQLEKLQTELDKARQLSKLKRGDTVKLLSGEIAEFQSLKSKNFVATMNGLSYRIPINRFKEIAEIKPDTTFSQVATLKPNELFYIFKGDSVVLFKFNCIKNGRIRANHPTTGGRADIDMCFYGGKVSDLK
jgi:uncharacterized protein YjhX (UPF0386 family)